MYSAEQQILTALEEMSDEVESDDLKEAFSNTASRRNSR